jgi:hypothetical protein
MASIGSMKRERVGQVAIAIVSAIIAAGSLAIAVLQYLLARQKAVNENERLANQVVRLRTARTAARAAVESTNLIVQRAKGADVTVVELQNLARLARGTLGLLADQLQAEVLQVERQDSSALFRSQSDDQPKLEEEPDGDT